MALNILYAGDSAIGGPARYLRGVMRSLPSTAGEAFLRQQKPPRGFYTVGRSFLFYCLIALTTLFRSCSSSQTILTGWL